jgi:hypothetical protein
MPAWPAVCNAVRRSQCTVKVAVGLIRLHVTPHLICGLMITDSSCKSCRPVDIPACQRLHARSCFWNSSIVIMLSRTVQVQAHWFRRRPSHVSAARR